MEKNHIDVILASTAAATNPVYCSTRYTSIMEKNHFNVEFVVIAAVTARFLNNMKGNIKRRDHFYVEFVVSAASINQV